MDHRQQLLENNTATHFDLDLHTVITAFNWTAAQSLSVDVDLISASLRLRNLLAAVDRHRCLYSGPALSHAITRYENCWLPLLAAHLDGPIIPPLDCSWIWYCHRLNPNAYARHCERVYGRLLDAPPHTSASVTCVDAEVVSHSRRLWELRFSDEPFELDLSRYLSIHDPTTDAHIGHESKIGYNLRSAVQRQSSFYYQISQPHMGDEGYLRGAEQRYKGFLHLFRMTESKVFLVPTYDIDLMWHAHMCHPKAYARSTKAILQHKGRVLDHDDMDSDRGPGQKLDEGYKQTSKLWWENYGRVYQRAGAMYRGEPPKPINNWLSAASYSGGSPPENYDAADLVDGAPSFIPQSEPLAKREVMQVYLSVIGAGKIRLLPKGTLQVRLHLLSKSSAFKLETSPIHRVRSPSTAAVWWNQNWRFQADTLTEGFRLELILRPSDLYRKWTEGSKAVLGRVEIPWIRVLESLDLSLNGWFKLDPTNLKPYLFVPLPYLFVSVSLTPPVQAPRLFRTINSFPTDDTGTSNFQRKKQGCWLSRTVLDHANREVFIVRIRYADGRTKRWKRTPESEKRINIHRGGWSYGIYSPNRIPATTVNVASAEQIVSGQETNDTLAVQRRWGFFGNSSLLVVRRAITEPETISAPLFQLHGSLADKVSLFSGRKLEYEVKGASVEDEAGFVTVVRHQPSGGAAQATALFNWRTGVFEASPNESVILVLLFLTITSTSVFDMQDLDLKVKLNSLLYPLDRATKVSGDEWGSVTIQGLVFRTDGRLKSHELAMVPYYSWWAMSGILWTSMFYCWKNGAFFEASGCGAAGACGGGACGGSACHGPLRYGDDYP